MLKVLAVRGVPKVLVPEVLEVLVPEVLKVLVPEVLEVLVPEVLKVLVLKVLVLAVPWSWRQRAILHSSLCIHHSAFSI